jgi:SNF2 family DNA or RNA helicase
LKYLLVNIESFQKGKVPACINEFIEENGEPFIILDESSKIKSNKACTQAKKSLRTQGVQKLNTTGHRLILTGTFISKSPVNAYDQMEFLKKNFFGEDMYAFESRYVILMYLQIGRGIRTTISEEVYMAIHKRLNKAYKEGGLEKVEIAMQAHINRWKISERKQIWIMQHEEYSPFMNVEDVYRRIGEVCMVVKKQDALDLPPKVYKTISVLPTPEMTKIYKELLEAGYTDEVTAADSISLYHRFQDVCNGYVPYFDEDGETVLLRPQGTRVKIDALLDAVESIGCDKHKIVVWSNRSRFLTDIVEALRAEGCRVCQYDGKTKAKEKDEIKRAFLAGEIDIFCGNQRSGAFGLDFLKEADYEIFTANDYSTETRDQAEDRIHRGGIGDVSKTIIDIVVKGTVDEKVTKNLKLGKELINSGRTDREVFALIEDVHF